VQQDFKAQIRTRKRWDAIFALCGLVALMIGVLTFVALFLDMAIDGAGRLSWEFFTNFPSRRPGQAASSRHGSAPRW
jgi:phosphate transport system permease protein